MSTATVASPDSGTEAVLDASAVIRGLVAFDERAEGWLRTRVAWPTLVYLEVAHAMLRLHRNRLATAEHVVDVLDTLYELDAEAHPVESLVRETWPVALARGLSAYDACYVVLAEGLGVPLVTADRRLAEATANAVLLS